MQAPRKGSDADPEIGDTVYIQGHGPGRLDAIGRGRKKYKIIYPDGSVYTVAREAIHFHQPTPAPRALLASPRLSGSMPSPRERSPSPPRSQEVQAPAPSSPILSTMPVTGPRRLEYLGRAFNDEARGMRTPSAIFGLIATMVGGGVLSLPYAMSQCGFLFGSFGLVVSGFASTWTVDMLIDCARTTGLDTFELVGYAAFGEPSRKLTMFLVFLICWLAMVAYFVLLGDLLVPTVTFFFPSVGDGVSPETLRQLILCLGALVLSPMCYLRSLGAVSWLCFASVGSVLLVLIVIAMRAWPLLGQAHEITIKTPQETYESFDSTGTYDLWPADWVQAWYALPTFGVSYLCHFNALPTHQELTRPTSYRIRRVTYTTMGLTTVLYFLFAFSGYAWSGCFTCGNILLNFGQKDVAVVTSRVALSLVLMMNFPLICQPSRNALFRFLAGTPCMPVAVDGTDSSSRHSTFAGGVSLPIQAEQPTRETALPELPEMHMRGLSGSFHAGPTDDNDSRKKAPAPAPAPPAPSNKSQASAGDRSWSQGSRGSGSSDDTTARVHVYLREDIGQRDHPTGLEAYDSFLPKDETVLKGAVEPSCAQRSILTTLLLGASLFLACELRSVMVVWSIVGSTVAFMVGYILPAAFWCKIVGPHVSTFRFLSAVGLIVVCVFLAISCTILTLLRLGVPPCPSPTAEGECPAS